ncbi:MAG: hypothetical protein WCO63_06705 [Bacteroidota bacterium]
MEFNHDNSWEKLESLLAAKLPIAETWIQIIDFHESIKPKLYWKVLRQLNTQAEQKDIVRWVEQILTDKALPKSIVALWIGISKIWDEETEREYYAICLRGSDNYDAEDVDWADEPRYDPENNFGIVGVLTEFNELIREDDPDDVDFLDWILPLAYCALTFDEIIRSKQLDSSLYSKAKNGLFVSVGFEEGDHIDISKIII